MISEGLVDSGQKSQRIMSGLEHYVASTTLPVAVQDAFAYHDRPGALRRLIPPWESIQIEESDDSLAVGSRVVLKVSQFGIPLRWIAEHIQYDPPHRFVDKQASGPFAEWTHRHEFESAGEAQSLLRDSLDYRLPAGPIGKLLGGGMVRKSIERMFAFRHRITRDDLNLRSRYSTDPLKIAISGTGGLVGQQLACMLGILGHDVRRIVRSPSQRADEIAPWSDPSEAQKFNEIDAVVHLAGKSIADKRWSAEVKNEIRDSRVVKTRELCRQLAALDRKPRVFVCASATGIYGNRGDELLSEESALGDDFLADVAQQWEQSCQEAIDAGIRVVNVRLGVVLSPQGGALSKMLLPAKFFGGALGSGRQWFSWISLDDVLGAIYHAIQTPSLSGPANLVAPNPVTNREFAKTLGQVIGRPAMIPAPAAGLRLGLGEMADALLLASARVTPDCLQQSGYQFRFTELSSALRYCLGRDRLESSK